MNMLGKCLDPRIYTRRALLLVNRHILAYLEHFIAPDPNDRLRHPPIFILGAPRSGSTLLVQVITDALDVGYITNRHCCFFGAPVLAERLFNPAFRKPASSYSSEFGSIAGAHAPSECGEWWYRFFRRRPSYVRLQDVDRVKMMRFRQSVAALTNAVDRPILYKNLYASLRIGAIAHYLPESLFIVNHRDEVDNGHSLLETRCRLFGDYERWWSMEPPQSAALKRLPAHQQVIEQIRHIYATIDKDMATAGVQDARRFDVSYEEFCADPKQIIDRLREFLQFNGCPVSVVGSIPSLFERRGEVRIDPALYDSMVKYAKGI